MGRITLPKDFPTEPNWDGYGAVPTTAKAIQTAENLYAVPLVDGGIQFELHAGGADVEIEIGPSGNIVSVYWAQVQMDKLAMTLVLDQKDSEDDSGTSMDHSPGGRS